MPFDPGVSIAVDGDRIAVTRPFHPDWVAQARKLGGKSYDAAGKRVDWLFDVRDRAAVEKLLIDIYGTDGSDAGTDAGTFTVRLDLGEWYDEQELWLYGRKIAERRERDTDVRLGPGVVVVAGEFPASGGSVRNPALGNRKGDQPYLNVTVEIRDIPARHPDLADDGLPAIVVDEPPTEPPTEPPIVAQIREMAAALDTCAPILAGTPYADSGDRLRQVADLIANTTSRTRES